MPPKKNPLKLNKLQLRTGDHLHIGRFTVSTKEASGLSNPAVWSALVRKGLARIEGPIAIALTAEGVAYDTGLGDRFAVRADH